MREIRSWGGELRGSIPEVEHTYAMVGQMNEHQLAIAETTTTGREELQNPEGLLHYWDLMQLALQRARTAREAIEVMTSLVAEHGYRSTAESFAIADPDEVWLMEMTGKGPGPARGDLGRAAGARRLDLGLRERDPHPAVPHERPGALPLQPPDVVDFAVEQGYWDPTSNEPFDFAAAYDAPTVQSRRYTATRVWSVFRRAAPSRAEQFDPAYHRGDPQAKPYPLWIEPDEKLSVADVMALMRDHYEGTPYDMTVGLDAGPFSTSEPVETDSLGGRRSEVLVGTADLDAADRLLLCLAVALVAARRHRRRLLVRPRRHLHHLLRAVVRGHRSPPAQLHRRHAERVQLGFGVVGVQLRRQHRQPQVLLHGAGGPLGATGDRGSACWRFSRRSRRWRWSCGRPTPMPARRFLTDYSVSHA